VTVPEMTHGVAEEISLRENWMGAFGEGYSGIPWVRTYLVVSGTMTSTCDSFAVKNGSDDA